jgi:hypothetical protein
MTASFFVGGPRVSSLLGGAVVAKGDKLGSLAFQGWGGIGLGVVMVDASNRHVFRVDIDFRL